MKKIIYLLSFTFLMLQSCSSGDSNNDNNNNNNGSVTDIDDNVYQTVTICDQVWTKKNLNVSRYRNGDVIPQVTNPTQWANLTTGAWCYYNNDPANGAIYGKLYNWYAVNYPRGLSPQGWHIPTHDEYFNLAWPCLSGVPNAGGQMKSPGTIQSGTGLWESPNHAATNESGFTALPGGIFTNLGSNPHYFTNIGKNAFFWTSSEDGASEAYYLGLSWQSASCLLDAVYKDYGFSVRCIKD